MSKLSEQVTQTLKSPAETAAQSLPCSLLWLYEVPYEKLKEKQKARSWSMDHLLVCRCWFTMSTQNGHQLQVEVALKDSSERKSS